MLEQSKMQCVKVPLSQMNVVVDIGEGKIQGDGMYDKGTAEMVKEIVIQDFIGKGVPEERLNIQVLTVEEALRGGYRTF